MVDDTAVIYTNNTVTAPKVVAIIFNGTTIDAVGQSEPIYIGGSTHVMLSIVLGVETGIGSVKFHIKPCLSTGALVGAYDYASSEMTAAGTEAVVVDEASATPLGDYVEISWSTAGTLSAAHCFTLSTVKIIAK